MKCHCRECHVEGDIRPSTDLVCVLCYNKILDKLATLQAELDGISSNVILVKDKARLPLTTKSEVIEDLRRLIQKHDMKPVILPEEAPDE